MRLTTSLALLLAPLALGGCTYHLAALQSPGRSFAFTSAGPWRSMLYGAKTDSGVVLIDLGWLGAEGKLRRRLASLDAAPGEVAHVFLTHSHRDHIGAWRAVQGARFHLWAPEKPLLEGTRLHADFPSRLAAATLGHPGPRPGEVSVLPFFGDTSFVLGGDTLRAYPVPGHTAGSAAYLFRRVLFIGDAVARKPLRGYAGADPLFTASTRQNRRSLLALFARVPLDQVEWVCNAHAKCSRPSNRFLYKVTR